MKPKKQVKKSQFEMFETRVANLCAKNHPSVVLAGQIEWAVFDEGFGDLYSDKGRQRDIGRLRIQFDEALPDGGPFCPDSIAQNYGRQDRYSTNASTGWGSRVKTGFFRDDYLVDDLDFRLKTGL